MVHSSAVTSSLFCWSDSCLHCGKDFSEPSDGLHNERDPFFVPLKVVFLTGDHIAALHWMSVAMNKVTESQSCGERAVMAEHFSVKSNSQCLQ